jgi:hypothetical protein
MFFRSFAVAGALICASGCATLTEMPPPAASLSGVCDREGATPTVGQQLALCGIVKDIRNRSVQYADFHRRASNERAAVQGVTLVAALAGGGFAAFDADDANLEAAGILAAGGLLLDRGLNMRQRVDILRSATAAMNCYAGVGNTFAAAYSTPAAAGDDQLTVPYMLDSTITNLAEHIGVARDVLAAPAAPGDTEASRTALTQAITRGEAMLAELVKAQRAFRRVPDDLDASWRAADADVAKRLAGIRPDLATLVREAQQLSAGLQQPATSGASSAGAGGQRGPVALPSAATAAANINTDIRQADRLDPGRYVAAYERLGQCKAMAAA